MSEQIPVWNDNASYPTSHSPMLRLLRLCSHLLPGDLIKTFFYLNFIYAPRRMIRRSLFQFYRYDHVYTVLREFSRAYEGRLSVLEFGTSAGYSFIKLLYAVKYLGLGQRVVVHGFDSFEGMPSSDDPKDVDFVEGDCWVSGQFRGDLAQLQSYCEARYRNFKLHKGLFDATITESFLQSLSIDKPVLIWIDCDYYSSSYSVLSRLIPYIPTGCVIYFDELDNLNLGSRFTGEARLVHEINHGALGDNIELVPDAELSLNSRRIYRFVRFGEGPQYRPRSRNNAVNVVRYPTNGSPLP